jgi:hypothetical protein
VDDGRFHPIVHPRTSMALGPGCSTPKQKK